LSAARDALLTEGAGEGTVATAVAHADDANEAESAVKLCIETFGAVDALVCNAATNPYFGPVLEIGLGQARKTFDVNVAGPLLWTQTAWRHWMSRHGGVVLNIASNGGYLVDANLGWYNTTKAALTHLTRQLAMEMGPVVRVNAIAPGLVKTEMSRALWEGTGGGEVASRSPLGRLGETSDIADAARFLCSDEASWITGQTLVVDGGFLVRPAL
jgi:NAD(P)-dependent dehydrogenase (short-subunit alcohol dehydrogenase family)